MLPPSARCAKLLNKGFPISVTTLCGSVDKPTSPACLVDFCQIPLRQLSLERGFVPVDVNMMQARRKTLKTKFCTTQVAPDKWSSSPNAEISHNVDPFMRIVTSQVGCCPPLSVFVGTKGSDLAAWSKVGWTGTPIVAAGEKLCQVSVRPCRALLCSVISKVAV